MSDTVKLLRECDSGIQMGISAINEVLENVHSPQLRQTLIDCRTRHEELNLEIDRMLDRRGAEGKDPSPMAKGMAWIKTNMKMAVNDSDRAIADLMTDGCNMGAKALTRYLNQYPDADESAKDLTRRLIALEETLEDDLHPYL